MKKPELLVALEAEGLAWVDEIKAYRERRDDDRARCYR
jgi:hypothetical protein